MTRARDVADTQDNLGGAVPPFVAGKNKIINGDFGVWQRGTSFAISSNSVYGPDRFFCDSGSLNYTFSRQAFTAGTAPAAGYESQYFLRAAATSGSGGFPKIYQKIEDVRTLAGQTVTLSFWIKASANTTAPNFQFIQYFGTGGSPSANWYSSVQGISVTTSWQRVSYTVTLPSFAGSTVGTNNDSWLAALLNLPNSGTLSIDTWGWQLEAGSVATPFTTATGTIQGELAACQRYYFRMGGDAAYQTLATGCIAEGSGVLAAIINPVPMRVTPTSVDFSTLMAYDGANILSVTSATINLASKYTSRVNLALSSSSNANRPYWLFTNNSTSGFIGFSAEL
jgi:hypothetical protein